VVCDGFNVYESLAKESNFTLAGCMAHIRRKFWQAEKWAKKEAKDAKAIIATTALKMIRDLYAIEARIEDKPPEEKLAVRQKESQPILDKLKAWLLDASQKVVPSSPTGKAISYALDQWEKGSYFARDGHVPIDNNFLEGHTRPFTVGRKNCLFAVSQKGADASAKLYSLIETCKANGLEPLSYLTLIFKELPKVQDAMGYEKLLPYNVSNYFELKTYKQIWEDKSKLSAHLIKMGVFSVKKICRTIVFCWVFVEGRHKPLIISQTPFFLDVIQE
jgi:transposase